MNETTIVDKCIQLKELRLALDDAATLDELKPIIAAILEERIAQLCEDAESLLATCL